MKKIVFENLISLAQQETPPHVDVADSVLTTLSGMNRQAESARAYLWTGIASAAAAACIAIAATLALQAGNDSVSEMMSYVSWVTQ